MKDNSKMLLELPPAPQDKFGWPWTEATPPLPVKMPDGSPWPKISIVTPSFNQAQYIEETIRSVLLQGYPNLEYIIIDGGSTDGSVEIIKKYEPWLTYWISEPDRGQSHAINKGFSTSTGDIIAWINSDDYYLPGAFSAVALEFLHSNWVHGATIVIEENSCIQRLIEPERAADSKIDACFKNDVSFNFTVSQPGHFWAKTLINEIGLLNGKYHYCMDRDWMTRALASGYRPTFINNSLACQRYHPESKTMRFLWAFDIDRANIYKDLSCRGLLNFWPGINIYREYAEKGYRSYSDVLLTQNKKLASLFYMSRAWVLAKKKIGGGFLTRVRRIIKS